MKYTLVRHSAWNAHRSADFEHAVEECSITDSMVGRIHAAGGKVYDEFSDAYEAANAYNYPEDNKTIIPSAAGSFKTIGRIWEVFIPNPRNDGEDAKKK